MTSYKNLKSNDKIIKVRPIVNTSKTLTAQVKVCIAS